MAANENLYVDIIVQTFGHSKSFDLVVSPGLDQDSIITELGNRGYKATKRGQYLHIEQDSLVGSE